MSDHVTLPSTPPPYYHDLHDDNGVQADVHRKPASGNAPATHTKTPRRTSPNSVVPDGGLANRKRARPDAGQANSPVAKPPRRPGAVQLQRKAAGEVDQDKTVFLQVAFILIHVALFIGEMLRGFGKNQLLGLEKARNWTAEANRMDKCWTDTPDTGGVAVDNPDVKKVIARLKEDRQSIGGRPVDEWLKDPANLLDGKLKKSAVKELAETCRNISTAYSDTSQTDQAQLQIDSGKITTLNTMAMGLIKEWKRLLQILSSP